MCVRVCVRVLPTVFGMQRVRVIVNQTRRRSYHGLPAPRCYFPPLMCLLSSSSSPVASSLPVHFSVLLWPSLTNSLPSFLPSLTFSFTSSSTKLHRPTSLPAFPPFHRFTASFYFLPPISITFISHLGFSPPPHWPHPCSTYTHIFSNLSPIPHLFACASSHRYWNNATVV